MNMPKALIEWKDEYSVGVEEIDNQHKNIFSAINELDRAIKEKDVPEVLEKINAELSNYSDYHFKTEEKYFKKFDYEFEDEHVKEHTLFKEKIKEIVAKDAENILIVSFNLRDFLEDWIIEHVTGSDQKYVECFHEHGLR